MGLKRINSLSAVFMEDVSAVIFTRRSSGGMAD
jgi:hypothetical protein